MPTRRTPLSMGEDFLRLQESRVQTYTRLNAAHQDYLSSAPDYDFKKYQAEVAIATNAFKNLSVKVLAIQMEINGSELETFISKVIILENNLVI